MSIASLSERKCCGCTACFNICPHHAILMVEDNEGFLSPKVDRIKCTDCGLCEKVCAASRGVNLCTDSKKAVYAAKYRSDDIRSQSQSGGAFYAIAEYVLSQGGAVYGASLDEQFSTRHIRIASVSDLHRLQKTKYVQSNLGVIFQAAAADLKKGIKVLFSGTPCQISGLVLYLQARRCPMDNLLTCDIVCYGVPSPGVFQKWKRCLEKAQKSKLLAFQYRDTTLPWGKSKETYKFTDGSIIQGHFYTKLYFNNLIIRKSCHECRYCNTYRPADITLGDFWGIEDAVPGFADDRGVSLIITHTDKGRNAICKIGENLVMHTCSLEQAIAKQPRLQGIPTKESVHRQRFWNTYHKRGFKYIAQDEGFIKQTLAFKIECKIRSIIGKR